MQLAGAIVLVLEDEPLIALDVRDHVAALGGTAVLARTLPAASILDTVTSAVLDVRLDGAGGGVDTARLLRTRGVPFVFTTGFERRAFGPEFADVPWLQRAGFITYVGGRITILNGSRDGRVRLLPRASYVLDVDSRA